MRLPAHRRQEVKGDEMLVLARKLDEEIVIDDHVVLKVLQIRGGTVRLGIAAPRSVSIERSEVRSMPADQLDPCNSEAAVAG